MPKIVKTVEFSPEELEYLFYLAGTVVFQYRNEETNAHLRKINNNIYQTLYDYYGQNLYQPLDYVKYPIDATLELTDNK